MGSAPKRDTMALVEPVVKEAAEPAPKVRIHFPEPTDISIVAASVAHWSKRSFVIPEGITGKVRIHSPHPMSQEEAYSIFLAALGSLGFRVVEQGAASKILPMRVPHYR